MKRSHIAMRQYNVYYDMSKIKESMLILSTAYLYQKHTTDDNVYFVSNIGYAVTTCKFELIGFTIKPIYCSQQCSYQVFKSFK